MTQTKKTLLVTAVLVSHAVVGSAQQAQPAASTPTVLSIPVTVTGPLPLPVTGTVSAQESGIWNVGITGTPSVNIANSPTVTLASPATPLLFRNVEDPGRIPYQSTQTSTPPGPCGNCTWLFPAVSANRRLVVSHISGFLSILGAQQTASVASIYVSGNLVLGFALPAVSLTTNALAFDQPVLLYVDGGSQVTVDLQGVNGVIASASITAAGYLLDCSAAPCAAIAQ